MVQLTPELVGNSLLAIVASYGFVACFSLVQLYLGWKQAKVSNQMVKLIEEVREIKDLLKEKLK